MDKLSTTSTLALAFYATYLALASQAMADCVTCHDFSTDGNGWVSSPPVQCGSDCNNSDACLQNCAPGERPKNFLESLHPGLFLQPENGHLFVSGVIYQSPADLAGIRPGDEIVEINDNHPGTSCTARTWRSGIKNEVTVSLLVRSHNSGREVTLPLLTIGQLLDNQWVRSELDPPTAVSVSTHTYGAYMFGLTWEKRRTQIIVTGVLRGSPAFKAGVAIGDTILAIDGVQSEKAGSATMSKLTAQDHRTSLRLQVAQGSVRRDIRMDSNGLSRVFFQSAQPLTVASVDHPMIMPIMLVP